MSTLTVVPSDADSGDVQQMARKYYLQQLGKNEDLSGAALAEKFDRSERWGRDQISAARSAAGLPARVSAAAASSTPVPPATAVIVTPSTATEDAPADGPAEPPAAGGPAGTAAGSARQDSGLPAGAGQLIAWCAFAFGSVISILANVMDARIPKPPDGVDPATWVVPENWSAPIEAQLGAAVWPIALLLSVEVLSRVKWAPGLMWQFARFGGVGTVGLGSAVISYGHIHGVLVAWGYTAVGAGVGPLVVDGLMIISGFALLSISQGSHRGRGKS